jgi:hypothetical protein
LCTSSVFFVNKRLLSVDYFVSFILCPNFLYFSLRFCKMSISHGRHPFQQLSCQNNYNVGPNVSSSKTGGSQFVFQPSAQRPAVAIGPANPPIWNPQGSYGAEAQSQRTSLANVHMSSVGHGPRALTPGSLRTTGYAPAKFQLTQVQQSNKIRLTVIYCIACSTLHIHLKLQYRLLFGFCLLLTDCFF